MANRSKIRSSDACSRIRELRISAGYTQKYLAELLGKGESTVRSWELGKSEPDLDTLRKLGEIFSVSIDYFLRKDGRNIVWGEETSKILLQVADEIGKPYEEVVEAFTNNPYKIKAGGELNHDNVKAFILSHYSAKKIMGDPIAFEQYASDDLNALIHQSASELGITAEELIFKAIKSYLESQKE